MGHGRNRKRFATDNSATTDSSPTGGSTTGGSTTGSSTTGSSTTGSSTTGSSIDTTVWDIDTTVWEAAWKAARIANKNAELIVGRMFFSRSSLWSVYAVNNLYVVYDHIYEDPAGNGDPPGSGRILTKPAVKLSGAQLAPQAMVGILGRDPSYLRSEMRYYRSTPELSKAAASGQGEKR